MAQAKRLIPIVSEDVRTRLERLAVRPGNAGGPVRQALKTPLSEFGLDLEPATPSGLQVASSIGRAWALVFGKIGNSLYPLSVDSRGRLTVQKDRLEAFASTWITFPLAAGAWTVHDFGHTVHGVEVAIPGQFGQVEFSMNNVDWYGDAHTWEGAFPMAGSSSCRSFEVTCRYVRIQLLSTPGAGTAYVIGRTLNP